MSTDDEAVRVALRACWDRFSDLMPDDLYEQVRSALHLLEFTSSDIEEGSEFDGPVCI